MGAVVNIASVHGLSIHTHNGKWPNKSKLVLYKALLHCNNHLKQLQDGTSVIKVGVVETYNVTT